MTGCVGATCGGSGTVKSERVLTHTVASPFYTGPLRSPLRIQNTFANECFIDELAVQAHADPVEYRLRHLRNERVRRVLQAVARAAEWKARTGGARSVEETRRVSRARGGVRCLRG
jgi:nicotinate dehydrogenase subunit B